MATSASITLEGFGVAQLYKHWDGSPESTLQWLKDFNQDFVQERGDDPSYKFAQLIRSSAFQCEKWGLDPSQYTGWGVEAQGTKLGVSYQYRLMKDGSVMVKSCI
jgi:hypothetical protein